MADMADMTNGLAPLTFLVPLSKCGRPECMCRICDFTSPQIYTEGSCNICHSTIPFQIIVSDKIFRHIPQTKLLEDLYHALDEIKTQAQCDAYVEQFIKVNWRNCEGFYGCCK
jgi:hypothetical protein